MSPGLVPSFDLWNGSTKSRKAAAGGSGRGIRTDGGIVARPSFRELLAVEIKFGGLILWGPDVADSRVAMRLGPAFEAAGPL